MNEQTLNPSLQTNCHHTTLAILPFSPLFLLGIGTDEYQLQMNTGCLYWKSNANDM